MSAIESAGFNSVKREALEMDPKQQNRGYILTKKELMGQKLGKV